MSRKRVQDINPDRQRSIRQVSIDKKKPRVSSTSGPKPLQERSINARRTSSKGLWFIAAIAVVFLFFSFSLIFAGTQVITFPKQASSVLDSVFEASATPVGDSQVGFEVMTLTQEGSRDIPATGEVFKEE